MNSESVKKPHVIAVMTVAATLLLATATVTMTNIGNAFAYKVVREGHRQTIVEMVKTRLMYYVQNLFSQIEGDGNAVNIIGLQTGGKKKQLKDGPPETCEECFTFVLSAAEQTRLINLIHSKLQKKIQV